MEKVDGKRNLLSLKKSQNKRRDHPESSKWLVQKTKIDSSLSSLSNLKSSSSASLLKQDFKQNSVLPLSPMRISSHGDQRQVRFTQDVKSYGSEKKESEIVPVSLNLVRNSILFLFLSFSLYLSLFFLFFLLQNLSFPYFTFLRLNSKNQ